MARSSPTLMITRDSSLKATSLLFKREAVNKTTSQNLQAQVLSEGRQYWKGCKSRLIKIRYSPASRYLIHSK